MDTYFFQALKWVLEHSTPPVLAAVSITGWLLKRHLERSWTRDLEAERAKMQRDHAALPAEQQRELEAHKVNLIAEAERARAAQDVAESVALRVAAQQVPRLPANRPARMSLLPT